MRIKNSNGKKTYDIYSYETSIIVRSHIMKQNGNFQVGISQALSTATPMFTPKFLTIIKSFQIYITISTFTSVCTSVGGGVT